MIVPSFLKDYTTAVNDTIRRTHTAVRLECSWVLNDGWLSHQRLELECDLIDSHLLVMGGIPPGQFIG
jgi:hypothetical protein